MIYLIAPDAPYSAGFIPLIYLIAPDSPHSAGFIPLICLLAPDSPHFKGFTNSFGGMVISRCTLSSVLLQKIQQKPKQIYADKLSYILSENKLAAIKVNKRKLHQTSASSKHRLHPNVGFIQTSASPKRRLHPNAKKHGNLIFP
ncbi:hypothetical protein BSO21_34780, partial [Paenibacillus odorifer]